MSTGSWAVLQAWLVSSLFHAMLFTLCIPIYQHLPQMTPEPLRLTISLVEPFDPPSKARSTQPPGKEHLTAALPSSSHPVAPPRPSTTVVHERESRTQRETAVQEQASPLVKHARGLLHAPALPLSEQSVVIEQPSSAESHAMTVPQPPATGLPDRPTLSTPAPALRQQTYPLAKMARNSEPPTTLVEPVMPPEIAATQPIPQAGEATSHPPSWPLDQPIRTAPVSSHTPSDANPLDPSPPLAASVISTVASPALPVTQNEGDPPPLVATRASIVDHGPSLTAVESGPIRKEEETHLGQSFPGSSVQARSPADYGWLQQALFHRLEELKHSSRPSIEDSGLLRVLVKAVVSSSGELMEAEIAKSSGRRRIDQEAMALVQRAFPMPLDRNLDRPKIVMRIPITFSGD